MWVVRSFAIFLLQLVVSRTTFNLLVSGKMVKKRVCELDGLKFALKYVELKLGRFARNLEDNGMG